MWGSVTNGAPHGCDDRPREWAFEHDMRKRLGSAYIEEYVAEIADAFGAGPFGTAGSDVQGVTADKQLDVLEGWREFGVHGTWQL